MKLDLPTHAVDGYEARWWVVEDIQREIVDYRAVYYVNTPYHEVEQARENGWGLPFVGQWQIFRAGNFVGRSNPGWDELRFPAQAYPTLEAARKRLSDLLDSAELRLSKELDDVRRRRKTLSADLQDAGQLEKS